MITHDPHRGGSVLVCVWRGWGGVTSTGRTEKVIHIVKGYELSLYSATVRTSAVEPIVPYASACQYIHLSR